jgi:hypothetical protein
MQRYEEIYERTSGEIGEAYGQLVVEDAGGCGVDIGRGGVLCFGQGSFGRIRAERDFLGKFKRLGRYLVGRERMVNRIGTIIWSIRLKCGRAATTRDAEIRGDLRADEW